MARRIGLVVVAAVLVAATGWLFLTRRPAPAGRRGRPNILLVTIDTLRADRVGARLTPTIERLASTGVSFSQARAAVPLTLPSHATIMTGLLPPSHGVRENGTYRFDGARPTLARLLKQAGYRTAAFVAAYVLDRRFGLNDGFDEYDDRVARDPNADARLEAERSGREVADAALAWLSSRFTEGSGPLFLWVHLYDPHAPYTPPPQFLGPGRGEPYDGEVAYADAQVARLVGALEARHLLNQGVTIIVGDHGESLGDHGERTHGMLLYESALRVPFVVHAPSRLAPAVRGDLVSLADVMPSLLSLLGQPVPNGLDGVDVLGTRPATGRSTYSETLYPRVAGWSPVFALTSKKWKLVSSSERELYDLEIDPQERHNAAVDHPNIVDGMTAAIARLRESDSNDAPSASAASDAGERLRALGYVAAPGAPGRTDAGAPNPAAVIEAWGRFEGALSQMTAGHPEAAAPQLRALVAAHPNAFVFQATYARSLQDTGNVRGALTVYRQAVARWPREASLYHDLAVAARAAGFADEAMRAERAALTLDPRNAAAHNGLGLLLADAERVREAASAFAEGVAHDPTNASFHVNLGNARRELGDVAGAQSAYETGLALDPKSPDAANGLGVLLVQMRRPVEAIPLFEKALNASPRFYEARLNLGIAYQESGQPAKAEATYRLVLEAPPRYRREREAAARLIASLQPTRRVDGPR